MVRWNLNAILSWVDSHIIDYPTAMNLNQHLKVIKDRLAIAIRSLKDRCVTIVSLTQVLV